MNFVCKTDHLRIHLHGSFRSSLRRRKVSVQRSMQATVPARASNGLTNICASPRWGCRQRTPTLEKPPSAVGKTRHVHHEHKFILKFILSERRSARLEALNSEWGEYVKIIAKQNMPKTGYFQSINSTRKRIWVQSVKRKSTPAQFKEKTYECKGWQEGN